MGKKLKRNKTKNEHLEHPKTSKMQRFVTIDNVFQPLINVAKLSIQNVCGVSGYASEKFSDTQRKNFKLLSFLPVPITDKERKLTDVFIFILLCGTSKSFMRALKVFLMPYLRLMNDVDCLEFSGTNAQILAPKADIDSTPKLLVLLCLRSRT